MKPTRTAERAVAGVRLAASAQPPRATLFLHSSTCLPARATAHPIMLCSPNKRYASGEPRLLRTPPAPSPELGFSNSITVKDHMIANALLITIAFFSATGSGSWANSSSWRRTKRSCSTPTEMDLCLGGHLVFQCIRRCPPAATKVSFEEHGAQASHLDRQVQVGQIEMPAADPKTRSRSNMSRDPFPNEPEIDGRAEHSAVPAQDDRSRDRGSDAPTLESGDRRPRPALDDSVRAYYLRDRTYLLRESEFSTLVEIGKFRVVDSADLAQFTYGGDAERMARDLRRLERQGLVARKPLRKNPNAANASLFSRKKRSGFLLKSGRVPQGQAIYPRPSKASRTQARRGALPALPERSEPDRADRRQATSRRIGLRTEAQRATGTHRTWRRGGKRGTLANRLPHGMGSLCWETGSRFPICVLNTKQRTTNTARPISNSRRGTTDLGLSRKKPRQASLSMRRAKTRRSCVAFSMNRN